MANRFEKYTLEPEQTSVPQQTQSPNRFAKYSIDPTVTEEQGEVKSGEWLETDNFSTAMAFMQGVTLGWYDEYRVGITALAESVFGDETYQQAYDRNRAEYDALAKSFQERQPAVATGAEITGAVLSPAAKVGTAAKGIKALTARGAAEGAVYGAGKAEGVEDIVEDAGYGALFGGVFGGTLATGGWLLKRKIEAPLEKDGVFTPITLAAKKGDTSESLLQSFYRDVVGPSLGGKGIIRGQEEVTVAPLVLRQKEREKQLKNFIRASKAENAEATNALNTAVNNIKETGKLKQTDVMSEAELSREIIGGKYDKFLGRDGEIIARKTEQMKRIIDNNNDMLRLSAFENSVPSGAKKADIANILDSANPNLAMHRLEKLWQKEGFRSIKDISFRMKPEQLLGEIEKRVASDTTLSLLAGKAGVRTLVKDALVTLAAKRNPKTGRIKGEDLSAIRSSFGMAASKMSDEGGQAALMQGLYREIQSVIDDNMKRQLSGKRLQSFEDDVASWASQSVLRDAVTKASTKAGRQGRFTPDEWIGSIKRNSPRQARRGEGPLRNQAEELAALSAKQEASIIESSNVLAKKLTNRRENELKRVRNKAVAEKAAIQKETATMERTLRNNPQNAERIASNIKKQDELEDVISTSKDELSSISQARTVPNPTWFHQMAASGIIGSLAGLGGLTAGGGLTALGAGMAGIATTIGASRTLATPTAQRIIAGQTPFQQAAVRGLQQPVPLTGMQAVDVITAFPRVGAGMLTGQEEYKPQ